MDEQPPVQPPSEPPGPPPKKMGNLQRGIPAGCERGPDGRIRKIAKPDGLEDVLTDGSLYLDMLHVRNHPKSADANEGHRDCRAWKEVDVKGFLTTFAALEKAHVASRQVGPSAAVWDGKVACPVCKREPLMRDDGSDRVQELIGRLLDEANGA